MKRIDQLKHALDLSQQIDDLLKINPWDTAIDEKLEQLKFGASTLQSIEINNLAYELEKQNPNLSFFEVNKLVKQKLNKPKLTLIQGGVTSKLNPEAGNGER